MNCVSNICFACLKNNNLVKVAPSDTGAQNDLIRQVKYVLPELMIFQLETLPVHICSSCHSALDSCYTFKKMCLENYERFKNYINILPGTSDTQRQTFSEVKRTKQELEVGTKLDIKEEVSSWEELDAVEQVTIKEELPSSEDSADQEFYQQLVKSESLSDVQNGGESSTNSQDSSENLLTQTSAKSGNKLQCGICNKQFKFNSYLKAHLRCHEGIKDFECHLCDKKYTSKHSLLLHLKTHVGIRDFDCQFCEKKFAQKGDLKRHLRLHTGDKNYECDICKKKFTQKGYLHTHVKFHAGIKDFECGVCNKKFSLKSNLQKHMRMHTR